MAERIPLQVVEGRLVLLALIECPSLRIHRQVMRFVIDTGSSDSYVGDRDVKRLQIATKGKISKGEIEFGGSRFQQISIPKFTMHLLKEDKQDNECMTLHVTLSALKTTKSSPRKIQIAQTLPSILGLDFLREQRLSLHVILTENIVYLQQE